MGTSGWLNSPAAKTQNVMSAICSQTSVHETAKQPAGQVANWSLKRCTRHLRRMSASNEARRRSQVNTHWMRTAPTSPRVSVYEQESNPLILIWNDRNPITWPERLSLIGPVCGGAMSWAPFLIPAVGRAALHVGANRVRVCVCVCPCLCWRVMRADKDMGAPPPQQQIHHLP